MSESDSFFFLLTAIVKNVFFFTVWVLFDIDTNKRIRITIFKAYITKTIEQDLTDDGLTNYIIHKQGYLPSFQINYYL